MSYENFKEVLLNELEKYSIKSNNKTIAIIFKVLCDFNIID